jgi:hypothetical protein
LSFLAVCLSFFPPSSKFQSLLEKYVLLQTNGDADTPEVPISIYAKVCQKRLEKILQTGPKKGLKKPTFEEIELSKVNKNRINEKNLENSTFTFPVFLLVLLISNYGENTARRL